MCGGLRAVGDDLMFSVSMPGTKLEHFTREYWLEPDGHIHFDNDFGGITRLAEYVISCIPWEGGK